MKTCAPTSLPGETVKEGREFGSSIIQMLLRKCSSDEEFTHSIVILQIASSHILASLALNADLTDQVRGDVFLEEMFRNIRSEFDFLYNENDEDRLRGSKAVVKTGGDPDSDLH